MPILLLVGPFLEGPSHFFKNSLYSHKCHINDLELLLKSHFIKKSTHICFSLQKNSSHDSYICLLKLWFWGPRPMGPMGPFMFWHFLKICFMVWDLSRSVPRVFRSPGNPLIKLFYFIFNSNATFPKSVFLYDCLLYCLLYCLLNSRSTASAAVMLCTTWL